MVKRIKEVDYIGFVGVLKEGMVVIMWEGDGEIDICGCRWCLIWVFKGVFVGWLIDEGVFFIDRELEEK